jgi:hypothetical protein
LRLAARYQSKVKFLVQISFTQPEACGIYT